MNDKNVAVVIVTYNRLEKLKNTIRFVKDQNFHLHKIVVVDNASTDGTEAYLEELAREDERVQHYRLVKNLGGAGGFNKGIKLAYQSGADFVWIMDDDCYPRADALQKLVHGWEDFVQRTRHVPGFACSLVKWHDDICEMNIPETVWDWPRFFIPESANIALVKHCSFVSVLISRTRIKEVGLPISEFFIWFDDVEYTKRLAKSYPGIYVMDSVVHHDLPENKGVNYGLVNGSNLWKYKYGARNQAYYHSRHSILDLFSFFYQTRRSMLRSSVSFKHRWQIYRAFWEGVRMKIDVEYVS